MSLLRDNPVFLREARWWYRFHWLRRNRSARIVTGVIVLIFAYYYVNSIEAVWHGDDRQFRPLWFGLQRFLLTLIVLLGPALAAAAIAREREQQTWEALLMTRITGPEVVVGKWMATLLPLGAVILATLPLMVTAYSTFGTSLEEMFTNILFFPLTATAYTMLGVACSFCSRRASVARVTALVISVCLCFGTLIVDGHLGTLFQAGSPLGMAGGFLNARQVMPPNYYQGMPYGYSSGPGGYPPMELPEAAWVSPFYALSALSRWGGLSQSAMGYYPQYGSGIGSGILYPNPDPSAILFCYLFVTAGAVWGCWQFITTRYGRDIRGERPLGETIS